ncbi:putative glutamate dehydrogenase [Hibiscus syriacus]|uniref:Glutamate dehydrogenase n=1 Tax=Hibiscus syriacus TaxID=106335 RepID=A0A6A2XDT0_HIBSY|nr:putative glutamate dehydrogenase [Hibiscus syriacus]
MCSMRFLLVFFSAILAGYVAWRTVRSFPGTDGEVSEESEKIVVQDAQGFSFKRMVQNGFWVFVGMASGKYLWRNLKELKNDENGKTS